MERMTQARPTMSRQTMSRQTISRQTMSRQTMSRETMSRQTMSRQTIMSPSSKTSFAAKQLSRQSSGRSRMTSILSLINAQRGSIAFRTQKSGFKVPRYQNTYQLDSSNRFSHIFADKVLMNVMNKELTGVVYNPIDCLQLCQKMAIEVRKQINKKDYSRYKIAVWMTIIEKTGQGINNELGFVWDAERDSYSKYVFETRQFYAIGIVAGVYYE